MKTVLFLGTPKVFVENATRYFGNLSEKVTIIIPVYSYPNLTNWSVKHDKKNITNSNYHVISKMSGEVHTTFYGVNVTLNGTIINITISNIDTSDFGLYILRLVNNIGKTIVKFNISAGSKYFFHSFCLLTELDSF